MWKSPLVALPAALLCAIEALAGAPLGCAPPATSNAAPEVPLPPPTAYRGAGRSISEAMAGPAASSGAPLDLAALGAILFHAGGVTEASGGVSLRAAPSAGALYPIELYVAADAVEGLTPGLYHYAPDRHALERVRAAPPAAEALGAPGDPAVAAARATVILSAVAGRTRHKYGERARRYVPLDAGHTLENLRVAAGEAGLAAAPVPRFDEARAARALGVDGQQEAVLLLVPLLPAQPRAAAAPPAAPTTGEAALIRLPPPEPAAGAALPTIARRRSRRSFAREPLPLPQLGAILAEAARGMDDARPGAVRVHLVAHRVAGLAPGAYRYAPAEHALASARPGDLRAEAQAAALGQEVVGGAAALVVLALDRAAAPEEGARGERLGLIEVGAAGERVYLGAEGRGLGACAVGAFDDEKAVALIAADPDRERVVHLVAVGALR